MTIPAGAASPEHNHFRFLPKSLRKLAPYVILVLAIFAAYGGVYHNVFLYDDTSLIEKNVYLTDWDYLGAIFTTSITAGAGIAGGFYRPMQILVYAVIVHLVGQSTFAFHLANIVLHAGNAALLYKLGRKLRFNPTAVFSAVLLWAMHPVHVEAIAYMSGTADELFAFFVLSGLVVMAPRFKRHRIYAAIPFFILALLSKEEAVVMPLLAACCIYLTDRGRLKPKTYLRLWPLLLVAFGYYIGHEWFLGFGDYALYKENDLYANSVVVRTYTFLASLPHYLGFLIWPVHLHFDRDFQPVTDPWNLSVLSGVVILSLVIAHVILGRSRRALALSWGLLWFAAAHLLHAGIIRPINSILLEHWMYLPSAGLFLGAAQSLVSVKWQRKQLKPIEMTILILVALALGVLTFVQGNVWRTAETFYLNIFKNGEPSPHAHNNLGVVYGQTGRHELAIEQFELSIELSGDRNPESQYDLAVMLLMGPDGEHFTQEAMRHLNRALEIDPDYFPADFILSSLYDKAGDIVHGEYYRAQGNASRLKLIGH